MNRRGNLFNPKNNDLNYTCNRRGGTLHSLIKTLHRRRKPGNAGGAAWIVRCTFVNRYCLDCHFGCHFRNEIVYRKGDLKQPFQIYLHNCWVFQGWATSPEFLNLPAMIDNIQENYIQKEVKFSTRFCIFIWVLILIVAWGMVFGIAYLFFR